MKLIACVDNNWGIGKDNKLLINIPNDMKRFYKLTKNHTLLMGKNTALSLPNATPLKNRTNIVLTHNASPLNEGFKIIKTIQEIQNFNDVFLVGGAQIYNQFYYLCEEILITKVYKNFKADCFLHNFDNDKKFIKTWSSVVYSWNNIQYQYIKYLKQKEI